MKEEKQISWKLPTSSQSGISSEVYAKLAINPKCNRYGGMCSGVCQKQDKNGDYPLELDHIVPQSQGGKNTLDNLQWLCADKNREKYNKPDIRYSGQLYFDGEIDVNQLRQQQRDLAYKLAIIDYKETFVDPGRIYNRFMLLGWLVGTGKTIGMLAILFGINHVRKEIGNGSARRIKRVLWLVHQKTLTTALAEEIRTELTEHDIAGNNPKVEVVTDSKKWGFHADVIVACPQALWDSEINKLNDIRRAEILGEFDAIIVDEAQFGVDHYLAISRLAPQAFKFATTSTPMNGDGELFCDMDAGAYANNFILYSKYGYRPGLEAGIFKTLVPYDDGVGKYYFPELGGEASVRTGNTINTEDNTSVENNLPRDLALVRIARNKAVSADLESPYDNHIMVRAGSILEAKALVKAFADEGDVCGVWSGAKGPSLGDKRHPWMLAKKHKGRIPARGKRIVIAVDIGQFGINNRYCSIIVWLSPNKSLIEIIQRIGRAIRGTGTNTPEYVRLIWNGKDEEFTDQIKIAIDYILNMEERLDAFQTMDNIHGELPEITVDPVSSRVDRKDRAYIGELMGKYLSEGNSPEIAKTKAIQEFKSARSPSDAYANRVSDYAEILTTNEGREKTLHIPQMFETTSITLSESPPDNYGIERLVMAVESGEISPHLYPSSRETKIERLRDGDALTIEEVKYELKQKDEKARCIEQMAFYPPNKIVRGNQRDKLPFKSYMQELAEEFTYAFGDVREASVAATRAAYAAATVHFSLPGFKHEDYQPFEKQLSAAMMKESERRLVIAKARYIIIKKNKDKIPGLYELYRPVMEAYGELSNGS